MNDTEDSTELQSSNPWADASLEPQYEHDPEYPMYNKLDTIDIKPGMTVKEYEKVSAACQYY